LPWYGAISGLPGSPLLSNHHRHPVRNVASSLTSAGTWNSSMLELAMCCRKLFALNSTRHRPLPSIFSRQNLQNQKPFSTIPLPCTVTDIEEQPKSTNTNSNYGSIVSLSNHPNPEISCFYQKGFSQITKEATGKALHALCIKGLVNLGVLYSNTLITMYSKFGHIGLARYVFDKMRERHEASWNNMMSGYVRAEFYAEAIGFFNEMRGFGTKPSGFAVASLVTACDRSGCMFDEGVQVHGFVLKFGTNTSVANSLVSLFGSFGIMQEVYNTFYGINDPDIISWNSLISANVRSSLFEESLRCFHQMRHVYGQTNSTTLSALLAGCGSAGDLKWGRGLHSLVLKFGLDSNVCLCNTLIGMYSDTGQFRDAELVFQGMADRDVISWNSMLACYAQEGNCQDALKIFARMFHIDKTANYVTFTSALAACSHLEFFDEGRRAHALAILTGLHDNLIVGNALITLYAKLGMMGEARKIFHRMPKRDLVTWNALIGGHADNQQSEAALEAFKLMKEECVPTNCITLSNVLGACLAPDDLLTGGMPIHAFIIRSGFGSDEHVLNSLIMMYAKCGVLNSSNYIFDGLNIKSAVAWNVIMAANAHHGCMEEALRLLVQMRRVGLKKMIKEAGYFPDTSYALQDTDDEQKEHNLWNHSERLALAYGLINTPEGSTIKVFKNLRVCGDCHSVYKLVSGILGRKIILRDPYRFHHFHGGKCSCSDYW
ncbi:hypothetical protein Tsubulata_050722, partial [Turnera subulata]